MWVRIRIDKISLKIIGVRQPWANGWAGQDWAAALLRRVALAASLSLHIQVCPTASADLPDLKFFGPDHKTLPLRRQGATLSRRINEPLIRSKCATLVYCSIFPLSPFGKT